MRSRKTFALLLGLWLAALAAKAAEPLVRFECTRPSQPDKGTAHNVSLACGLVDGTVVQPGKVFSYYRALTPGAGKWQPGITIRDGRYIQSYGGGYCQVSTALYNAVLLAGLLVIERYPHSIYDSEEAYAKAGFDCAVSRETKADFQFVNTRLNPIVLKAYCQGPKVTAEVWGQGKVRPRWVSSEIIQTKPKKVRVKTNASVASGTRQVLKKGLNGLVVRRFLHELDASGNTRTFRIGTDHYDMVPEIVEAGPVPALGK